jgi:hypothetical protein
MSSVRAKIIHLEQRFTSRDCLTCYGWPSRLVFVDAGTGEATGESLPADGCPACGRPIRRTHVLHDGTQVLFGLRMEGH